MGILKEPAQFVRDLKLPKGFTVCELGDQWVTHEDPHRLARYFYKELGCKGYDAIDGNGRGTITWDLNLKWTGTRTYDLVTDFGTAEHIFNQAQVWRTVHVLTKAGGYIAFDKPISGYPGHGFYRYDPSMFSDLALVNRYEVIRLETGTTKRGELIRGVFKKTSTARFVVPQQGRYLGILQCR